MSGPDEPSLDAEEWGAGDWRSEAERPPAPWPTLTPAYLLVLVVGVAGLALMGAVGLGQASPGLFRVGAGLVAGAVCLAAVLRAVLPDRRAGMLVLRSRRVDVLLYGALGVAAVVLAILVPPPTG